MAQTKYLLPISDRGTAKPWVRNDTGGSIDVYQAVNDTVDYRASVEVEPVADPARHCWGDSDELAYGSNSLWNLNGDLPTDAINLHLWLKGWFTNGIAGPPDQPCAWQIFRQDEGKSFEQAFTVSGNGDPTQAGLYVRYTLDLGATEPWSGGVTWTPTVANVLKIGVRRAGTSTYRTFCATYYLAVTYDLPAASVPRRATALLF